MVRAAVAAKVMRVRRTTTLPDEERRGSNDGVVTRANDVARGLMSSIVF